MTDLRSLEAKIAALQARLDAVVAATTPVTVKQAFNDYSPPIDASFHTIADLDQTLLANRAYVVDAVIYYIPSGSVGTPAFQITAPNSGLSRLAMRAYIQGSVNIYRLNDFNVSFGTNPNQSGVGSFVLWRGFVKADGSGGTMSCQVSCGAGNSQVVVKDCSHCSITLLP